MVLVELNKGAVAHWGRGRSETLFLPCLWCSDQKLCFFPGVDLLRCLASNCSMDITAGYQLPLERLPQQRACGVAVVGKRSRKEELALQRDTLPFGFPTLLFYTSTSNIFLQKSPSNKIGPVK